MTDRIALFVDGDNMAAQHADSILAHARTLGRIDVMRCYLNLTNCPGWQAVPGFRLIHAGAGKNAADLLLAIDAMEFALSGSFTSVVLASSDTDFAHLAHRLRERGLAVHGIGEPKASSGFRVACTSFIEISLPAGYTAETAVPAAPVDHHIRNVIAKHSKLGRGMRVAELAPRLHAAHGIKISDLPEKTWRAYLKARPSLYEVDPRGPDAMVRFRPAGFSESP